ncbi:crotonyl-CoA carboxylase/reductase [Streptomyces caniscabiei]|uniref:crotonyl-CoA carboxylase/reductase n=1 Tax=Streptomyces caniscabiei TaxID=2746961 RepID=UPI0029AD32A5|nr:crotonyl-CoA carboxylase/reductase [Streptomyces caniscabiei]MDX2600811.1 crotonyl-CoA carboxylase/reductase [Streptomyces caniscabiei]MDX2736608.1 crotonyl-CoA carboxylase/reductase [Streptomyces caniscabiei]MDX2780466.1 crotonyl-CoA carboxylase/reductase [Streptomyces caniscabiei]
MGTVTDAVLAGAHPEELEHAALPEEFTAAHLRVEDVDIFRDVADKDVRKTLRVGPVPMPEPAPDEVLVAVMASSINYNTVWSAIFEPLPTFRFLASYGRQGGWAARHDQPFHVLGSDAAGVIVRVGSAVRRWRVGDHVLVNAACVDEQEAVTQADGMLGEHQLAWGYETNFGGLAHYCLARAGQLIPKPAHLTWEEAASVPACAGTSYRMLVSDRGARMKQGDVVLIWGATGGVGAYAVQFVKNGGGIPVGVVGSPRKAEALRALGCDIVIDRSEIGIGASEGDDFEQAVADGKRLGAVIRRETGEDPHIVFEHVGQATFGMSLFVVRRGGTVVTCGSSTGYRHRYDNRYLWMKLKRVIGSHVANLHEQWECARLFTQGRIMPVMSSLFPLDEVGEATRLVQRNEHIGKVGVLCLAPEPGLGVTDPQLRARIGADRLNPLRPFAADVPGALEVTV